MKECETAENVKRWQVMGAGFVGHALQYRRILCHFNQAYPETDLGPWVRRGSAFMKSFYLMERFLKPVFNRDGRHALNGCIIPSFSKSHSGNFSSSTKPLFLESDSIANESRVRFHMCSNGRPKVIWAAYTNSWYFARAPGSLNQ